MALYAVLLAGGMGTRLWPLSTPSVPKQFLTFQNGASLLQQTVERILPLIPFDRIFVMTFPEYVPLVHQQLPQLPDAQIIREPAGCDMLGAIGLAATLIAIRDPQAVIGSLATDIYFADDALLRQALMFAGKLALDGALVAFAVPPTSPETGYGYIEVAEEIVHSNDQGLLARAVRSYREKPSLSEAQAFIRSGNYFWNTGYFVWRADCMLSEIRAQISDVSLLLDAIYTDLSSNNDMASIPTTWPMVGKNLTLEKSIIEKAQNLLAIPLQTMWSDLGNWMQIAQLFFPDDQNNRIVVSGPGNVRCPSTHDTFIYSTSGRAVAVLGVQDLLIIDTQYGVLLCHKDKQHLVREIIAQMQP